jgi:hypothetical protein
MALNIYMRFMSTFCGSSFSILSLIRLCTLCELLVRARGQAFNNAEDIYD